MMKLFETAPTVELVGSTPFGQRFLENEIAVCRFYLDNQCIYEAESGEFFCHPMNESEKEFFYPGQHEPVPELDAIDPFYDEQLKILKERDRIIRHFSFQLCSIEFVKEDKPMFYIYSGEDVQVFFVLNKASFDYINEDTYGAILKLDLPVNRLTKAYALTVDEDGGIIRIEGVAHE